MFSANSHRLELVPIKADRLDTEEASVIHDS